MPTISPRNDRGGKYLLRYQDVDGTYYRIDTGATDEKVARVWLAEAERRLSLARIGQIEKVGRITIHDILGIKKPGRPWNSDWVTHRFKCEVKRAGLPESYSLHSLRHTYTTHLRSRGVPRDIVQALLGHTTPETTSGYDHTRALYFRHFADLLDFEEVGANRAPEGNGGDKKSS